MADGAIVFNGMRWELARENDVRGVASVSKRAWVAVNNVEFVVPQEGKQFSATVHFKNTGKTFAKRLSIFNYTRGISNGNPAPNFEEIVESDKGDPEASFAILAPGVTAGGSVRPKLVTAKESAEDFKSGKKIIYFFGKISYCDIFGLDHWTTFCYVPSPRR